MCYSSLSHSSFYLSLVSLSLSLLVRVSLISEGLFILFLTKQMSHEMLHHVEFQIFFELLHMFDLV
jgi:sulfur relay (sulfurtransferase) DsrF/TusC family protein